MGLQRRDTGFAVALAAILLAPGLAFGQSGKTPWTGTYAGLSLGSYAADATETERLIATGAVTAIYGYTGDGRSGSVFVGQNWRTDRTVYGVEFALSSGEKVRLDFGPADNFEYATRAMLDLSGRYGYLWDDAYLVYGKAGITFGNYEYDWVSGGVPDSGTLWSAGYTVGLGVERQMGDAGVLRLSLDYDERDTSRLRTPILPANDFEANMRSVSISVGYLVYLGD